MAPNPLFVSDVDGTLVDRKARLSAATRARLCALLEQGLPFTVASARSAFSLRVMLKDLPLKLPVIEFNGAFLTDLATGHRPFVRALAEGVGDHVIDLAARHGLRPFVSAFDGARDRLFAGAALNLGMQWYLDDRKGLRDDRLEEVADVRVGLVHQVVSLTFIAHEALLSELHANITQHHAARVRLDFYENRYSPGWHWLTVHDHRATKAVALAELCAALNVQLADVTVFGDERNDIPMFQVAGRGVAVDNAHPELKQHASELIGDHETDAVVEYLERVYVPARGERTR